MVLNRVVDSLEECSQSSDTTISSQSISSVVAFLHSLQTICHSNQLNDKTIEYINRLYATVEDAEFEGFDVRKVQWTAARNNAEIERLGRHELLFFVNGWRLYRIRVTV